MKPTTTGVYHGKSTKPLSPEDQKKKSECDRVIDRIRKAAIDALNEVSKDSERSTS